MPSRRRCILSALSILSGVLACSLLGGVRHLRPAVAQTPESATVVRTFAVGGVLTSDGTLWQYLPDKKKWFTIDEAFRAQGKQTRILPLPVAVTEIADLSTWGFLLTTSGSCWLYDIQTDKWTELPPPEAAR